MNIAMELHDSQILSLARAEDGTGEILFDAVIYYSEGTPGSGPQISGWQHVRMRFSGMTVQGEIGRIGATQTDIYDGSLSAADNDCGGYFPIPAAYDCPIILKMFLSSDDHYRDLEIRAVGLQITVEDDFNPDTPGMRTETSTMQKVIRN